MISWDCSSDPSRLTSRGKIWSNLECGFWWNVIRFQFWTLSVCCATLAKLLKTFETASSVLNGNNILLVGVFDIHLYRWGLGQGWVDGGKVNTFWKGWLHLPLYFLLSPSLYLVPNLSLKTTLTKSPKTYLLINPGDTCQSFSWSTGPLLWIKDWQIFSAKSQIALFF